MDISTERMLDDACRVVEATVSIREGRQRAQYIGAEKFMSRTIDFRVSWELADKLYSNPQEAAEAMKDVINNRIMEEEQAIHEAIMHAHGKDNPAFAMYRKDNNAFVKAGNDVTEAARVAAQSTGAGFIKSM